MRTCHVQLAPDNNLRGCQARDSSRAHVGNLHGLLGRRAEPERHIQDGQVISTYLDDLEDGHLHDLFFCAVLHGFEQENLTQRIWDGLFNDAHAQRHAQKKRHNSNDFLRIWQIPCSNQFGIRVELAVVKKLANAVLVRGRKSLRSQVLVFVLGLDTRSKFSSRFDVIGGMACRGPCSAH